MVSPQIKLIAEHLKSCHFYNCQRWCHLIAWWPPPAPQPLLARQLVTLWLCHLLFGNLNAELLALDAWACALELEAYWKHCSLSTVEDSRHWYTPKIPYRNAEKRSCTILLRAPTRHQKLMPCSKVESSRWSPVKLRVVSYKAFRTMLGKVLPRMME